MQDTSAISRLRRPVKLSVTESPSRSASSCFVLLALFSIICPGIHAQNIITTIAGSPGSFPRQPVSAVQAPLGRIAGVAVDKSGNVYASDLDNQIVVRIGPDGVTQVVAGNGIAGYSGDGGPAISASLNYPGNLALDPQGNLYIADILNGRIRKVDTGGVISTLATRPLGGQIAIDSAGNLYVAELYFSSNRFLQRVSRIDPSGGVTIFAGGGTNPAWNDGDRATDASFDVVYGIAVDGLGTVYLSIAGSNLSGIVRLAPDGTIQIVYSGAVGFGMAADRAGNVYVPVGNQIWKISPVTGSGILGLRISATVTVYAGTGQAGFSGDGSIATSALLRLVDGKFNTFLVGVLGLAVDGLGNLYFGDLGNNRVRRVGNDGIISTTAGNGQLKSGGDGGAAISAHLDVPTDLAADGRGNLYILDFNNSRIRRIDASGTITTYAGGGNSPASGIPAVAASLHANAIAVDRLGNLFVADGNVLRQVTPDGFIRTIAGTGDSQCGAEGRAISTPLGMIGGIAVDVDGTTYISQPDCSTVLAIGGDGIVRRFAGSGSFGNTTDGLPAKQASLLGPARLALDSAGNLYIANLTSDGSKIFRVTKNGMIQTYAGGGPITGNRDDDGAPAVGAVIDEAGGMAIDKSGNLIFVDIGRQQVRMVSPDQRIHTVAGTGQKGFAGDGGPATHALFTFTLGGGKLTSAGLTESGVALDSSGNLYVADSGNDRVRVILARRPAVSASLQKLTFAGQSQGAPTQAQPLLITSAVAGLAFHVSIFTADGGAWLQADATAGASPRLIEITADPFKLSAGSYHGSITINAPDGDPQQLVIPVNFEVGASSDPKLIVDATDLSFPFPRNGSPRTLAVLVSNGGSGTLDFTVSVGPDSARSFLIVDPSSGSARPGVPVTVTITADPTGLTEGTYTGQIDIQAASGEQRIIPVVLTVSASDRALLLSQTGISFTAIAKGGMPPPQNFAALNLGNGVSDLSIDSSTLGGGSWLSAALASSNSSAQTVEVSSDPTRLTAGRYYGLVTVGSAAAANSPQVVTGLLDVLPEGTDLGAVLQPNEILFSAPEGGSPPSSRDVLVYNLTASPKPFRVSSSDTWLATAPPDSTAVANRPARIVVQPFTTSLGPGTYRGTVTLQFDDGRVRIISVTVVVTPATALSANKHGRSAEVACQPTKLLPALTSLGNDFSVPGGWPVALQVQVQDDCGTPLEAGSVVAEFSNGDPPISLIPLRDGKWDGTWQNKHLQAGVTITVKAASADRQTNGIKQVSGGFGADRQPPAIADAGITDAASSIVFRPLSPGTLINISGDRLSDQNVTAPSVPLATSLANTSVLMAGQLLPLAVTAPNQITAIIPYGIAVNTRQQVLIQRNDTYSQPVGVNLAASSPSIFTKAGTQGMIVDASGNLVAPGNAARTGDTVTIYCTGLGELQTTASAGDYGPPSSTTASPVAVNIGGQDATVNFNGLAPGLVGIYFVQAVVPDGVATGDQVPVTITSLATPPAVSQMVTMAVQQ